MTKATNWQRVRDLFRTSFAMEFLTQDERAELMAAKAAAPKRLARERAKVLRDGPHRALAPIGGLDQGTSR